MLISPPRGFSLLEVLIVISIITISTTYAIFSFTQNEKKIIGVVANSDFGSILVTINDGPIKMFNVGERSKENLIFEGINDGVIRFSHDKKFYEMPFLSKENKFIENK